jgi:hypothetical protein
LTTLRTPWWRWRAPHRADGSAAPQHHLPLATGASTRTDIILADPKARKVADMKRLVAEWLWRAAVLCALIVIAWELQLLRSDISQPVDDQTTTAAAPDETLDSLDGIRDDLAQLTQKVDAILMVMARAK